MKGLLLDALRACFVTPTSIISISHDWQTLRPREVNNINGRLARTLRSAQLPTRVIRAILDFAYLHESGTLAPGLVLLQPLLVAPGLV